MACIRALAIIEYQVINRLIFSTKTYVVGIQKNRRNETIFQASNYDLNLISLKNKYNFTL